MTYLIPQHDPALSNGSRENPELTQLRQRVEHLEIALSSQRLIGTMIGILAQRYGCTSEQAWSMLVRLSQHTQHKVRDIARVLVGAFDGRDLDAADAELLAEVSRRLPDQGWPVPSAVPSSNGQAPVRYQDRYHR